MKIHAAQISSAIMVLLLMGMPMVVNSDAVEPKRIPMSGSWGGDRVNAQFNAKGAVLEYDCAKGLISQIVVPDPTGRFAVSGTHERYRPGPDLVDQASNLKPASYLGAVVGTTLTLTVRIDGDPVLHTYRLEKNRHIKLARCL
jgi:hypothetical protein